MELINHNTILILLPPFQFIGQYSTYSHLESLSTHDTSSKVHIWLIAKAGHNTIHLHEGALASLGGTMCAARGPVQHQGVYDAESGHDQGQPRGELAPLA